MFLILKEGFIIGPWMAAVTAQLRIVSVRTVTKVISAFTCRWERHQKNKDGNYGQMRTFSDCISATGTGPQKCGTEVTWLDESHIA